MPYEDEPLKPDPLMRRYAPLEQAVGRVEMRSYLWKREDGAIQSYKHKATGEWLHISQGSDGKPLFYDRYAHPIEREQALERVYGPRQQQEQRREDTQNAKRVPELGLAL